MLPDRSIVVVLGKGGVGRTTVAHALAIALAGPGREVALVEVNGATALAEAAGVPARQAPQRVATGVDLLSLTTAGCLAEYAADRVGSVPLVTWLFRRRIVRALLAAIPGLVDLVHHGKIHSLLDHPGPRGTPYDVVVVDAPATGHGVAFLETPAAVAAMTRIGPLHEEALAIARRLADPARTAAVVVTLAEALPAAEAVELTAGLGPTLAAVVVNRAAADPFDAVAWPTVRASLADPALVAVGDRLAARLAAQARATARLAGGLAAAGVHPPIVALPALSRPDPRALAAALARGLP
ncbi:MAG: ArsA-related P-loop ATPase [Myxococcota bacterium]